METLGVRAMRIANDVTRNVNHPDKSLFRDLIALSYMQGARDEREEFIRWRDPKEEQPEDGEDVLIKTTMCRRYCVAFFKNEKGRTNYRWHENNGAIDDDMVVGWRPIIEKEI